jgi:hypothetical protein
MQDDLETFEEKLEIAAESFNPRIGVWKTEVTGDY